MAYMGYKSMINRLSEEHMKITLYEFILTQSIKTFVVLMAEHIKGLNIFLAHKTQ
jgi:hypothetical protein